MAEDRWTDDLHRALLRERFSRRPKPAEEPVEIQVDKDHELLQEQRRKELLSDEKEP